MTELHTPRLSFVPSGSVLEPRAGVVAVDVGCKCVPGVIDHHFLAKEAVCATSLIVERPELVLDHIAATTPLRRVVMHTYPDFDCVASTYLVLQLSNRGKLPDGAGRMADYARRVTAGSAPESGEFERSPWAVYLAGTYLNHEKEIETGPGSQQRFRDWVTRGLDVVEAALGAPVEEGARLRLTAGERRFERARELLAGDQRAWRDDLERATGFTIRLPTVDGGWREVRGLRSDRPQAAMFKAFARQQGFDLLHLQLPPSAAARRPGHRPGARHVISVTPGEGLWLRGLGAALEAREVSARARLGRVRSGPPRWPDVTNGDPWYDGRSPVHGHTIVDSPRRGTCLSMAEVLETLEDVDRWAALGTEAHRMICPRCDYVGEPAARFCLHDGAPLVAGLVGGRYEIRRVLGRGGMGQVFEVVDRVTSTPYALKVLKRRREGMDKLSARFLREARLANLVSHPNLVEIADMGADSAMGLFIVSELLRGHDLRADMKEEARRGSVYPRLRLRSLMLQVCDGLAALHEAGAIHRDLKPENIMLCPGEDGELGPGTIKLVDFGLAVEVENAGGRVTSEGHVVGTPHYLAPELLESALEATPRTDVYSLGLVLFELLTGELPHAGGDNIQVLWYRRLSEDPPNPAQVAPAAEIPAELADCVQRMLAVEPGERPGELGDIRAVIEQSLGGSG